ncbi:hypothetical protein [Paraburkholderia atlantica]|uniref:hypothetical protein n=1 Tax=Paraburkholderia atlantica TaxID=2654982 RepID=UPI003D24DB29
MSVVKSFTRGQWEALGRRLEALPEKARDRQPLKVGDGVKSIRAQISAAQEKGYTLNELLEEATEEGIDVSLNSLRYAMRRAEGKRRARQEDKGVMRDHASRPTPRKSSTRANEVRDNPSPAESEHKRDGGTTRSEISQVQGFLGFPIRPDTENL